MKYLLAVTALFISSLAAGCGGGKMEAEAVGVRVVPYVTAQGKSMQMVLVDWKNTGTVPLAAVFADIMAYDVEGNKLRYSYSGKVVFAALKEEEKVKPEETYTAPNGEGFLLMPLPSDKPASRVTATIVGVSDKTDESEHMLPVSNGNTVACQVAAPTPTPTSVRQTHRVTYRVTGNSLGVYGRYANSPYDEVFGHPNDLTPIPPSVPETRDQAAYTRLPWETMVDMEIGRKRGAYLFADNVLVNRRPFNPDNDAPIPPITVEILVDDILVATKTGQSASVTVVCDENGCREG